MRKSDYPIRHSHFQQSIGHRRHAQGNVCEALNHRQQIEAAIEAIFELARWQGTWALRIV
jgi:hypothetical protein